MRPIWKGNISFGLVTIPVLLHSGEAPQADLDLDMLDRKDLSRIRFRRVNETTGKEVAWKSIAKGYEYEDGEYVLIEPEDFELAAQEVTRGVELLDCVKLDDVSPAYFEKPYYLEPGKGGEKGYALLREALKHAGLIGIAKTVLQRRPRLGALIPQDDLLVLQTMRYPAQIRSTDDIHIPKSAAARPTRREIEMAEQLVKGMATRFDPARYRDNYRAALDRVIQEKVTSRGKPRRARRAAGEIPPTYNIMDLLRKSVEGHKAQRARSRTKTTRRTRSTSHARRKAG